MLESGATVDGWFESFEESCYEFYEGRSLRVKYSDLHGC